MNDSADNASQSLAQDAARFMAATPHGVLATTVGGSPAQTDEAIGFGQSALGDTSDSQMVQSGVNRSLMENSAAIGSNDGAA